MSLMRLLTAGKSLVGIKDTQSRYRIMDERLLPKFASKANPFRGTTKPGPALVSAQIAGSTPEQQPRPVSPSGQGVSVNRPERSRWLAGLRRLLRRGEAPGAKSAIPRFNEPMVQPELSLDAVKVVRNDLSDSDLEIVPATAQPAAAPSEPARAEPALESAAGPVWTRVTGRLFGTGE